MSVSISHKNRFGRVRTWLASILWMTAALMLVTGIIVEPMFR
jgi:hypothetical protein